jgi:peptide deformylase
MIRPILRHPHPLLLRPAAPVTAFDPELWRLVADMVETLWAAGGVGLAAPQVGVPLRLIVVGTGLRFLALANPVLLEAGGGEATSREACLSFPGASVAVPRPRRIRLAAVDPHGAATTLRATGALARRLLHELDHLAGRPFDPQHGR